MKFDWGDIIIVLYTLKNKIKKLSIITPILIIIGACTVLVIYIFNGTNEIPTETPVATSLSPSVSENVFYYYGEAIPVIDSLKINEYDADAFYYENGYTYYDSEDARYGIDVSSHQGEIDWGAVASSGIDFAIIRAGYRGYGSEGVLAVDTSFVSNIEGAINAGLDVGVYFFSQAISEAEAREEANFIISLIKDYEITYPVVFDWERVSVETARTYSIDDPETLSLFAAAFCETISDAGYTPAVYFNSSLAYFEYDLEAIAEYTLWLAEYDPVPDFYYYFQVWQYSSTGTISGIEGNVDLNISFTDFAA